MVRVGLLKHLPCSAFSSNFYFRTPILHIQTEAGLLCVESQRLGFISDRFHLIDGGGEFQLLPGSVKMSEDGDFWGLQDQDSLTLVHGALFLIPLAEQIILFPPGVISLTTF